MSVRHRSMSIITSTLLVAAAIVAIPPAAHARGATTAAVIDQSDYQQVTLAKGVPEVGEPMAIAVLPDRSVLHTARDGKLRRTDADGTTTVIGTLPVYTNDEDGLQGVAVDPGFATNRHVYLYYAPPLNTPAGDAPSQGTDWTAWHGYNKLSRFTLDADFTLNTASEVEVLRVGTDRGICCHVGGDIDFDAAGNLYMTTGDDTNPFVSGGYAPIDERADSYPAYDAQRSAGNTNDLRGKVLRIHIEPDGSYTIPAGNLFPPGTAKTRPEIYAMGFRNPFRMSVDKPTGVVYLGDYGPDAGSANPARGPSGQVEFNRITEAGNFGWPYCTGYNTTAETYNEWDFGTNTTGPKFDCTHPVNNSRNNTGLTDLPPAHAAWIRYAGDTPGPAEFGSGSESPMGGPVYHFDAANPSTTKFPRSLDGQFFAADWGRHWIKPITVNADGSPGAIDNFPWTGKQAMDMAFGPDGSLYVLDYGAGFGTPDANSALYRFDYVGAGNKAPAAKATADVTSGQAPLTVHFSSSGSADPDGDTLTYAWAFGDGSTSTDADPVKTFTTNGTYAATLTVKDPDGATGTAIVQVVVGNTAPKVVIGTPGDGSLFTPGAKLPFNLTVTDPEDGATDCTKATVTFGSATATGCSGELTVPAGLDDATVFDAQYTDKGGLVTHARSTLQPRHQQAEHYTSNNGMQIADHAPAEGGQTAGFTDDGDWIGFAPYRLDGVTTFTARVSSAGAGGTVSFRTGSPTGPVIGSATVPITGDWEKFTDITGPITGAPSGATSLYLTFAGPTGNGNLFDVDSFEFGSGTVQPPAYNVLLFSKTAAFRHDAIPAGIQAIKELGAANGFGVTATEDASAFTADNLAKYQAVIFLSTTGDVLNNTQQAAFESYIRAGGGYMGVHAAADTEYDWPFYGELVGAYFQGHPAIQQVAVKVEDRANAATAHLPQTWLRTDELYNYRTNPRATSHVLATYDEGSYTGGTMGSDHPITWCKNYQGGRSFYTGMGHTQQSYTEANFRQHLLGGIEWAAGQVQADCRPESGYTALYNGSTTGWQQAGPGGFSNSDATLSSSGGLGLYWYTPREYRNFSLKLDWKMAGDDNSGVFLGFPPSDDPWSAVDKGYEVQIDATDAPDRTTGSVYSFQSADLAARDKALNPPGQWNDYELRVEGQRLRVYLNGTLVNDFTNTNAARSLAGHIGIQNHGTGDDVSFRNIRIKELPATGTITGVAGKCLDVDGVQAEINTCKAGAAAQVWTVQGATLRSQDKCLTVAGTLAQVGTCNGTAAQNWVPQSDGTVKHTATGQCLDVTQNSARDGATARIAPCRGSVTQRWTLPQ
ncbi:DUF1080 domain-containing protein [Actinoplanes sp. TBRC 11911]|nr:DUF1080 domain-containing protein [Actinoplanes sp. TBRC 11911]